MENLFLFGLELIPSWEALLVMVPSGMIYGYYSLHIAGHIKERGVRTPYTRKMVHVAIFLSVAVIQLIAGLEAVVAFGIGAAPVVFYATLIRGRGYILYEGIARETDEPMRTTLVLLPFGMTVLGALFSNYNFGELAIFGYLVAGIGDAVGEPVGARFGKSRGAHWPSMFHLYSKKTYAGSGAVFVGSLIAICTGSAMTGIHFSFLAALIMSSVVTAVELFSPRGCDNVFMQIVPAYMVYAIT